jgi:branched-subunit amino acid transport protein
MSTDFILVLGMSVVTMIPRMVPAFLAGRWTPPRRVRQWLDAVPYAALGALIVPGIFQSDPGDLTTGAAAAVAALVAALLRAPVFVVGIASVVGAILPRLILP